MAQRHIFQVKSPLGYNVTLTRDRWREIVRFKHPALAGHEHELRNCVEQPKVIRHSAKDATVHLYYSVKGQTHLCVVAAPESEAGYFVVTAYFTKKLKKGDDLWTS
jgi:hypothetical protein